MLPFLLRRLGFDPASASAPFVATLSDVTVVIAYSNEVSVRYVSSENLDSETSGGGPVIHRGYNKRAQRLSNQISTEIAILRATNALPSVAAPSPGDTPSQ